MNLQIITSDKSKLVVEDQVALQSMLIKGMLEDIPGSDEPIPLVHESCTFPIVEKIFEFLKMQLQFEKNHTDESEITEYEKKFVAMEDDEIFNMIMATNYLDIKKLLDLLCKAVAEEIKKCKTTEDIRKRFNIVNDFTPEEEQKIREENCWYDDD